MLISNLCNPLHEGWHNKHNSPPPFLLIPAEPNISISPKPCNKPQ
nr:MAG TPA: hypothetical protein [Caudoviricetes sp.]